MFNIPFLAKYIKAVVKEQAVADAVDWLNYYCTSLMLAFFSLAISAKQYFGSPIKCWTPNEFKGGWDKYAESYCFIQNSYYVPYEQEIPSEEYRTDQISYYRWVPIVLACQAFLFWLPNYLWNMLHKQTAINPRAIVSDVKKSRTLAGPRRDEEIKTLSAYLADVVSVFHPIASKKQVAARSGFNATVLYLAIKLVYAANAFGQLFLMNKFLGGEYLSWGISQLGSIVRGEEWKESSVFPRVILCDFTVRRLANTQRHTIQCVMMLNMINEKLYFFLYFWFLFVGCVTLINFFYHFIVLSIPALRTHFVLLNINRQEQKKRGLSRNEISRFVHDYLRPDGVLLFKFIRQHVGGRVTFDLLNEMMRLYRNESDWSSEKSSPNSERTRKSSEEAHYSEDPCVVIPNKSQSQTYQPTRYGPADLQPLSIDNPLLNASAPPNGTPNSHYDGTMDYIDSPLNSRNNTLPIGEMNKKRRSNGRMTHSPTDV